MTENREGLSDKTPRERILQEVMVDLAKTEQHLLADIFDEFLNQPTHQDALLHGLKRALSLFIKFAISSHKTSNRVLFLTWVLVALTAVLTVLTVVIVVRGL